MTRKHELIPSSNHVEVKGITLVNGKPSRKCHGCGHVLVYKSLKGYEYSEKQNAMCRSCGTKMRHSKPIVVPDDLTRACPTCDASVIYKSAQCYRQAEKSSRRCRACSDDATRATTRSAAWRTNRSDLYVKECAMEGSPMSRTLDAFIDSAARCGGASKPEIALVEALRPLGFLPQQKVGNRRVDAANHTTKVAVEFQGDWWHVRPGSNCEKEIRTRYNGIHPRRKITIEMIWALDAVKHAIIRAAGYTLILIPENEKKFWMSQLASLENEVE